MELEYKYLTDGPKALDAAADLAADLGWRIETVGQERHKDEYWDTPDFSYERSGVSLRLRTCEGKKLFTQKGPGEAVDGLFRREEWEYETGDVLPQPLTGPDINPVLVIETTRRRFLLAQKETLVELAGDEVFYSRINTIVGPEYQVELELKSGQEEALHQLAKSMSRLGGFVPMEKSKYRRGMDIT